VVAAEKAGLNVPALTINEARLLLVDAAARLTLSVYVFTVVLFCAVSTVLMVLLPTASGRPAVLAPEVATMPFTLMVVLPSLAVGVSFRDDMAYGAEAV